MALKFDDLSRAEHSGSSRNVWNEQVSLPRDMQILLEDCRNVSKIFFQRSFLSTSKERTKRLLRTRFL
jgi:hypothetical protein